MKRSVLWGFFAVAFGLLSGCEATQGEELLPEAQDIATSDAPSALDVTQDVSVPLDASPPDIQVECIHIIGRSSQGSTARGLLLRLFEDANRLVRQTAAQTLASYHDEATFKAVRALAERKAATDPDRDLAQLLGETLASVNPQQALALFTDWIRPRVRLRLSKAGEDQLPWVAVPGLAALQDPQADTALKAFAERQRGELARAATQARVRRARRFAGEGSA